jgi:hypothetical protein
MLLDDLITELINMIGSQLLIKHYPWVLPLMQSLPDQLMRWLDPNMGSFLDLLSVSLLLNSQAFS